MNDPAVKEEFEELVGSGDGEGTGKEIGDSTLLFPDFPSPVNCLTPGINQYANPAAKLPINPTSKKLMAKALG